MALSTDRIPDDTSDREVAIRRLLYWNIGSSAILTIGVGLNFISGDPVWSLVGVIGFVIVRIVGRQFFVTTFGDPAFSRFILLGFGIILLAFEFWWPSLLLLFLSVFLSMTRIGSSKL